MKLSRALCATTALATGLLISGAAFAQSSGTAIVEELVVTGSNGPRNIGGSIVAIEEPKSRVGISEEFISRQMPGQTVLDTINLLPGVNFTNNDPFGSAGGDVVIRGIDSQRIALLQDGVPLNDSGNYAIYPNQQLDSDLIERVTVNLGTTDVDSPTAAAAGGTINYITKRARDEFGVRAEVGAGDDNYQRYYATIESGAIGPFGTKMWISGLYTKNDLFRPHNSPIKPGGKIEKKQFNARIDQEFGDFGEASLIFNYNENRNNFYRNITLAQFKTNPQLENDRSCSFDLPVNGTAQNDGNQSTVVTYNGTIIANTSCTNFHGLRINPSNTGNIRGQARFTLTDNLILTVDPSFQYVLANGGGYTAVSERSDQLDLGGPVGVDLNGDGDDLDTVALYSPNTTNTRRYGVTSSLIWDINDNNRVRIAYTGDFGNHRQTGDYGFFNDNGTPQNVFGGKDGYGRRVKAIDGSSLRRRDRFSKAILNQVALEYRGQFMDDALTVIVGARAPYFKRELNQYCYSRDGSSSVLCTTQTPNAPLANGNVTFGTSTTQYIAPYSMTKKYNKVLPNLGMNWNFAENQYVYASYAEGLSAPRTDNLYTP
ncbi:MAG: TonB-dependent receptor, partial [Opitutaceae bacterium]|nr:TonB-dependent receptor [Opitutaceae bacterium]